MRSRRNYLGSWSLNVAEWWEWLSVGQRKEVVDGDDSADVSQSLGNSADSEVEWSSFLRFLSIEKSVGIGIDSLLEHWIIKSVLSHDEVSDLGSLRKTWKDLSSSAELPLSWVQWVELLESWWGLSSIGRHGLEASSSHRETSDAQSLSQSKRHNWLPEIKILKKSQVIKRKGEFKN